MFVDHTIAFTWIGGAIGLVMGKTLRTGVATAIFSGLTLAPMMYWLSFNLRPGSGQRPANIHYENDVSKDEVERF